MHPYVNYILLIINIIFLMYFTKGAKPYEKLNFNKNSAHYSQVRTD